MEALKSKRDTGGRHTPLAAAAFVSNVTYPRCLSVQGPPNACQHPRRWGPSCPTRYTPRTPTLDKTDQVYASCVIAMMRITTVLFPSTAGPAACFSSALPSHPTMLCRENTPRHAAHRPTSPPKPMIHIFMLRPAAKLRPAPRITLLLLEPDGRRRRGTIPRVRLGCSCYPIVKLPPKPPQKSRVRGGWNTPKG